jgi:hypothetical protein
MLLCSHRPADLFGARLNLIQRDASNCIAAIQAGKKTAWRNLHPPHRARRVLKLSTSDRMGTGSLSAFLAARPCDARQAPAGKLGLADAGQVAGRDADLTGAVLIYT